MTFPEEHKINEQAETGLMVKSSFSDPGSFFGLMAMCAAHQAVLAGYHIDLSRGPDSSRPIGPHADYYFMKDRCIREMNAKMRDSNRALSDESFDTIVNLLTSTVRITFSELHFPSGLALGAHISTLGLFLILHS